MPGGEGVERRDPGRRQVESEGQPACEREPDPRAGETARPGADGERVEVGRAGAGLPEQGVHVLEQGACPRDALAEQLAVGDERARRRLRRRVERQDQHLDWPQPDSLIRDPGARTPEADRLSAAGCSVDNRTRRCPLRGRRGTFTASLLAAPLAAVDRTRRLVTSTCSSRTVAAARAASPRLPPATRRKRPHRRSTARDRPTPPQISR